MLDIKALEKALSVIGNVGKGELTLPVDGVPVTLRVLTADEDIDSQKYSQLGEDEGVEVDGITLLERYKRSVLSYAIVQVGPLDLRNEDYVATGEVTEKGVPVRVPRHQAVRKLVDGWARVTTMALFQKYLELLRRVDAAASDAIHFDVEDINAEIDRVEKRLADLKAERDRAEAIARGARPAMMAAEVDAASTNFARNLAAHAGGESPAPKAAIEQAPAEEPAPAPVVTRPPDPEPPPVAPVARQRVLPQTAPPPVRPAPMPVPQAAPPAPPPSTFDGMQDSLGDGPSEIAAETARLVAARNAARNRSLESALDDVPSAIPAHMTRSAPPHRAAANTMDAVLDTGAGDLRAARVSGPQEGVETYRLDPTPVADRARLRGVPPKSPQTRVAVNEEPKTALNNPRYRPPGR